MSFLKVVLCVLTLAPMLSYGSVSGEKVQMTFRQQGEAFQQLLRIEFSQGVTLDRVRNILKNPALMARLGSSVDTGERRVIDSRHSEIGLFAKRKLKFISMTVAVYFNCEEVSQAGEWSEICFANKRKGETGMAFEFGQNSTKCLEEGSGSAAVVTCEFISEGIAKTTMFRDGRDLAISGAIENLLTNGTLMYLLNGGAQVNLDRAKALFMNDPMQVARGNLENFGRPLVKTDQFKKGETIMEWSLEGNLCRNPLIRNLRVGELKSSFMNTSAWLSYLQSR